MKILALKSLQVLVRFRIQIISEIVQKGLRRLNDHRRGHAIKQL